MLSLIFFFFLFLILFVSKRISFFWIRFRRSGGTRSFKFFLLNSFEIFVVPFIVRFSNKLSLKKKKRILVSRVPNLVVSNQIWLPRPWLIVKVESPALNFYFKNSYRSIRSNAFVQKRFSSCSVEIFR